MVIERAMIRLSPIRAKHGTYIMDKLTQTLLTTKQAAAYLGVSLSFLEKDRVQGARIPFVRIGHRRGVRYSEAALQEFVRRSTYQSTSEYAREVQHDR